MNGQRPREGGGNKVQRIADELRRRVTDGTYPLQSFLPSQRDLVEELGVSRETVKRALRELEDEGWIATRPNSGSRVVKTQHIHTSAARARRLGGVVTLGPFISEAFEQPEVALDVYTLTSESLDAHIRVQTERIRSGLIAPRSIALRMLLPDSTGPLPYPRVKDDPEDPRMRDRMRTITEWHTTSLLEMLGYLRSENLVPSVDVRIRHTPLIPAFKLYLLNDVEVLHGMYEIVERPVNLGQDETITALDALGLGATLTHHEKTEEDPTAPGSVFVDGMRQWFDSVWDRLSE
ncbi:winged helix-turn-helix domain-containing protein [Streptomyces sp. NPDC020731]|uniref:winged helix-turn-helix domain-containing protein n=1 Tax=Streptomyces sp. NPDC020731 TaxID=3365085 RepID=UPI0037B807BC